MISVTEANDIILSYPYRTSKEIVTLDNALGRTLAEAIRADRDFPPFDRVSMDGIAIRFAAYQSGRLSFVIEGTQAAGQPATSLKEETNCLEVMTGTLLPSGTDTVVPYEWIEVQDGTATLLNKAVVAGQNVHGRASDVKQNDTLLEPGTPITPAEIALLATTGNVEVLVYSRPRIAVLSTGDELVDIDRQPLPHQIRKSNSYVLLAALQEAGFPADTFHLPDDKEKLSKAIANVLQHYDVIILSGGVSKGKFDYVPQALEVNGITKLFHQVNQRPGKPFWFGRSEQHTVFALPGNPVSTHLCFYRYIKPWLAHSVGLSAAPSHAILAGDFSFSPSITYFLQVAVKNEAGKLMAYPHVGSGSGDFANLKLVTGFLELPFDKTDFKTGEVYPYYALRH